MKLKLLINSGLCMFLLITGTTSIFAQNEKTLLDTGNVEQQFKYVITKSNLYSNYRAVKATWLRKLRDQTLDTLSMIKSDYSETQKQLQSKIFEVDSLAASVELLTSQLEEVTKEKDSMNLAGIQMSKKGYNAILWIVIFSLFTLVVIVFIAYKRTHVVITQTKVDLNEVKEEFEAYRKSTREKNEKIARKHLDELLKYKNRLQKFEK